MADLKDNVKVALRIRPLNSREQQESGKKCVTVHEFQNSISLETRPEPKIFTYDYVADEYVTQEQIFDAVGKPIAKSSLSGYNGTIFAYGQTGAGKTFTIQGLGIEEFSSDFEKHEMYNFRGLLPRCFEFIFHEVNQEMKNSNCEYLIKCSYLEIYQEQINDLLDPSFESLQIREDMKRGVYVEGLIEETVINAFETYELLRVGTQNRHVGSTSMNKESSRSHSVFTLLIESKHSVDGLVNFRSSRFHLIDLAGSERQKATDAAGDRLKEAGMINKSLSALGNVINSLVDISEGKSRHVHYRDSKLTFLLKDSLGGNSKTYIVANISPAAGAFAETLSTLKFAQRAKQIKNTAVVNEDTSGSLVLLREEIKRLKEDLVQAKNIAEQAVINCPRCANKDFVPGLKGITPNERISQLELLLEHNIRLRQESVSELEKQINEKDKQIQSLNIAISKYERKITNDKMVLKFRDSTISRLQGQPVSEEDSELENLKKENEMLREQIESNPIAARLFVENDILQKENDYLKQELANGPSSIAMRLEEEAKFTQELREALRESTLEKENLKALIADLQAKSKENQAPQIKINENQGFLQIKNTEEDIFISSHKKSIDEDFLTTPHKRSIDDEKLYTPKRRSIDEERQAYTISPRLNNEDEITKVKLEYGEKISELNEQLLEAKSAKSKEMLELKDKNILLEIKIAELQRELDTLKINSKEKVDEDLVASASQIDEILKTVNEQQMSLQAEYLQRVESEGHLKEEVEKIKKIKEELENECKVLKKKIEKDEVERETIGTLVEEREGITIEINNLKSELGELRSTAEAAQRLGILEQELLFEKAKREEKENELKNALQDIENLGESFEYLKANIEENKKTIASKDAKIAELKQDISRLEAFRENQDQLISSFKSNKDPSESISEIEPLKNRIFELEQEKDSISRMFTEASLQMQELKNSHIELKKQEDASKQAMHEQQKYITTMKKEISGLEEKINAKKEKLKYYKEEHRRVTEENEELAQEKSFMNKEKINFETNYISSKEENDKLSQQVVELSIQVVKLREEKESRVNDLTNEIKHLESELFQEEKNREALLEKIEILTEDLTNAQANANHYQQLSISLSQKNAEFTSEISKLRDSPKEILESLEYELQAAREEIATLKEENHTKMEILKSTNKNILSTRNEINMWKKCIDEKNQTIQDLRLEIRRREEGNYKQLNSFQMKASDVSYDSLTDENEIKYWKQKVQIKDKELKELKEKGQEYYSQADEAMEIQRKEIEVLTKKYNGAISDVKKAKEDLKASLQDRETMLEEIKRLRSEEYKNFKENEELRNSLSQAREEKNRLMRDIEILNKENDRLLGNGESSLRGKGIGKDGISLIKINQRLTEELKLKGEQVENLQKKFMDLSKKISDPNNLKTGQQEEIQNLTEGLARITDFVFSLPIVNSNPEETNIVESTIKAIAGIYEALQEKQRELNLSQRGIRHDEHSRHEPFGTSQINKPAYKSPIAQYHALLNASSIKPGELLSPSEMPKVRSSSRQKFNL
ncbi:unnamed protein product [Blepharisma stoltei]|uniref:Kinesin motor domain-containing protein n=1 Tax=Blepharisma stoltei TaxID=1481888 RepID=A0AAU9JJB3_9CILI|nr:unnamed protein product [Blepharisma stoltei]